MEIQKEHFTDRLDQLLNARPKVQGGSTYIGQHLNKALISAEDEAKLKAALEKDPAWNELYRRCQDVNTAIGENRRETMAAVRERLTRGGAGNGGRPSNQAIKQSNTQTISK